MKIVVITVNDAIRNYSDQLRDDTWADVCGWVGVGQEKARMISLRAEETACSKTETAKNLF